MWSNTVDDTIYIGMLTVAVAMGGVSIASAVRRRDSANWGRARRWAEIAGLLISVVLLVPSIVHYSSLSRSRSSAVRAAKTVERLGGTLSVYERGSVWDVDLSSVSLNSVSDIHAPTALDVDLRDYGPISDDERYDHLFFWGSRDGDWKLVLVVARGHFTVLTRTQEIFGFVACLIKGHFKPRCVWTDDMVLVRANRLCYLASRQCRSSVRPHKEDAAIPWLVTHRTRPGFSPWGLTSTASFVSLWAAAVSERARFAPWCGRVPW